MIIDFITHRRRLNLGEVRKELRPWVGLDPDPPPRPPATAYQKDVEPIKRDLAAVLAQFAGCAPLAHGHKYLEEERRIPRAVTPCWAPRRRSSLPVVGVARFRSASTAAESRSGRPPWDGDPAASHPAGTGGRT